MSIYGDWETATIASSGTTSGEVNLGRDYEYLQIILPALTSGTVKIQVSRTTGGTFQDLGNSITTPTTTGGYSDVFRLGGYQFIKVVSSAAQAATRTIYVRGMRV